MPDLPILVVDDEHAMREGLRDNLEFEGYAVDEAADGEEALQKLRGGAYRLVVLDVMMPKRSGFEVLREARAAGVATPVILLTAKAEEFDTVRGLEFGADDYVTKPFGLGELLARIKAVLRRTESQTASPAGLARDVVEVGRLRVDLGTYQATSDGEPVAMTHLEVEVLRYFAARPGAVVSRDDLLDEVWGSDVAPTARTVDNFVLKLRQKAEPDPAQPRHFLTVHGVGYKFLP
ncbi:response regulator transcription factor [Rubrivirga marina]|uniref:DNA-binding response regulator n=1 Tax=Rubrivirga marina TaxID=1196024 RepID=A0A271IZN8_9BACT|nr:response regulator transcription factor [Rubrivirga marina]PAP76600.1 DNA-binding response regulator [Rubrivirga marina]